MHIKMESDRSGSSDSEEWRQLADALNGIRNSWINISLVLTDLMADTPSPERDEVLTEVERCLSRLREADKNDFD
jgi:hypothetical protein